MHHIIIRLHAGLCHGTQTAAQLGLESPHLRTGSLDGASGICSLYMALITLGVATRFDVQQLRVFANDRLENSWLASLNTYFLGSEPAEIMQLLRTVKREIRYRASNDAAVPLHHFALARLSRDDVVLMNFEHRNERGGEWVLAVGAEFVLCERKLIPLSLLCLDAAAPAPSIARFNGKLLLQARPSRGRYRYVRADEAPIAVKWAFSLAVGAAKRRKGRRVVVAP